MKNLRPHTVLDNIQRITVAAISESLYLRLVVLVPVIRPFAKRHPIVDVDIGILFYMLERPNLLQNCCACLTRKVDDVILLPSV